MSKLSYISENYDYNIKVCLIGQRNACVNNVTFEQRLLKKKQVVDFDHKRNNWELELYLLK